MKMWQLITLFIFLCMVLVTLFVFAATSCVKEVEEIGLKNIVRELTTALKQ